MIIEFTVGNFLSFNEKRTLSFKAKGISELKHNIIKVENYKLLRSIVVYGANSSGKSNLIKAFERMQDTVGYSVKLNDTDELNYSPFLLSTEAPKSTHFEIIFLLKDIRYRYGFEYNLTQITKEWLYEGKDLNAESPLFLRTMDEIAVSEKFKEGKGKEVSTGNNRLFLSLVAQLGGKISKTIMAWFMRDGYGVISGLDSDSYIGFSFMMFKDKSEGCNDSLHLFQKLKLGFKNLEIEESEFHPSEIPDGTPQKLKTKLVKELSGKKGLKLVTLHNKYDKKGNINGIEIFDKRTQESQGTNKIIDLAGPIFDVLNKGQMLIVDELDAKLHPLITMHIVGLFNNPETNPNNAQLLFATHDTNLLSSELFRRDQIWFAEKDSSEQTDLYALVNINLPDGSKIRNDASIEKNYIRGRYGAIPFITN